MREPPPEKPTPGQPEDMPDPGREPEVFPPTEPERPALVTERPPRRVYRFGVTPKVRASRASRLEP